MLRADYEKVYIEHCINCNNHKWCTSHDESKYISYFTSCKNAILRVCSQVTVLENQVPLGYQTKFITDPNTSKPGKSHFPRIGSFEVYFRGFIIFSKIQTVKWPLPSLIANKIKEIQDSPNENLRNKKKERAKSVKSAAPGKKKKVKKGKKKFGKLEKPKSNY